MIKKKTTTKKTVDTSKEKKYLFVITPGSDFDLNSESCKNQFADEVESISDEDVIFDTLPNAIEVLRKAANDPTYDDSERKMTLFRLTKVAETAIEVVLKETK